MSHVIRDLPIERSGAQPGYKGYDALLMVGFGGPERREDVMPFLENVLRGRNVPRERMLEVAAHYEHFDGVSPINQQMRELIAALRLEFDRHGVSLPIYWGNRNWHPLLTDTLREMSAAGVRHALAYVASAYSSYSSCRQYREDIERARAAAGPAAPIVDKVRAFYNHPLFIAASAERLREALSQFPADELPKVHVAFTAHSIPLSMAQTCDYERQLREACRLTAEAAGLLPDRWQLVYQSRSGRPQDPWLEPDILGHLRDLAGGERKAGCKELNSEVGSQRSAFRGATPPLRKGGQGGSPGTLQTSGASAESSPAGDSGLPVTSRDHGRSLGSGPPLIVMPIGFLSDHMEVLYDLDFEARNVADALGLRMTRAGTVGTHPLFVRMIRELIQERLSVQPARAASGQYSASHDFCPEDCCPSRR